MKAHMKQWNKDKSWVFNILGRWTTKMVLAIDSHPISVQHFSVYLRLSMCWSPSVWTGPEPDMHSDIPLNRANKLTFNCFAKLGWYHLSDSPMPWEKGKCKRVNLAVDSCYIYLGQYLGRSCSAHSFISQFMGDETQGRQRQDTCWRQIP